MKWLIILLSFSLLAVSCDNAEFSKCLQDANDHYATLSANAEHVQVDGTFGVNLVDRAKLSQNLLQEQVNCKILYK